MPLRNMMIFGDRQLYTVEAIVRRILLAFRQRPPFQLLRAEKQQPILTINSYRKLNVLTLYSYQFRTGVEIEVEQRHIKLGVNKEGRRLIICELARRAIKGIRSDCSMVRSFQVRSFHS